MRAVGMILAPSAKEERVHISLLFPILMVVRRTTQVGVELEEHQPMPESFAHQFNLQQPAGVRHRCPTDCHLTDIALGVARALG